MNFIDQKWNPTNISNVYRAGNSYGKTLREKSNAYEGAPENSEPFHSLDVTSYIATVLVSAYTLHKRKSGRGEERRKKYRRRDDIKLVFEKWSAKRLTVKVDIPSNLITGRLVRLEKWTIIYEKRRNAVDKRR